MRHIKQFLLIFCTLITCGYSNLIRAAEPKTPFVIVIHSDNAQKWYRKNLDSIFSQTYSNFRVICITDGSTDGSDLLIERYIKENHRESQVLLFKNQIRKGHLACMCQAVFSCQGNEVVVELNGNDWLAHPDVLSTLNNLYSDPDVWMTYGQLIHYPSFLKGCAEPISQKAIQSDDFRSSYHYETRLRTFYASLFQEINKDEFLESHEEFSRANDLSYLIPILEMAGSHAQFIPSVLYVLNADSPARNKSASPLQEDPQNQEIKTYPKYLPLTQLPHSASTNLPPYEQIKDICHPTLDDYRMLQNHLLFGKRENLERLGPVAANIKQTKFIGDAPDEVPATGSLCINCDDQDKENCVLIYATFNHNSPNALKRLLLYISDSDYQGHVLYRIGGWPDEEGGSLVLSHVPDAFKASFFMEAQKRGFRKILWIDPAAIPIASLNTIFNMIEEKGFFIVGNPCSIGTHMNQQAAAYFGLTWHLTFQIQSCAGELLGIDLSQETGKRLLASWYRAAHDKDAFFSLRSAQNALSILLYQYGIREFTDIRLIPNNEKNIKPDSLFCLDREFANR